MHNVPTRQPNRDWLTVLRLYLSWVLVANLVWETSHLPLYTIWRDAAPSQVAFAIFHCTGGDVLIAGASLLGALLLWGSARWPGERYWAVAAIAIVGGFAYTMFSEWLNIEVRGTWTYTDSMPRLPLVGTGLTPLAQWLVVPTVAFWWTRHRFRKVTKMEAALHDQ